MTDGELLFLVFAALYLGECVFLLRGQGVADALMQACLQWCEQQHYQLVATCSYAVRWLERKQRS